MSPRIIAANLVVSLKSFSREKSAMFFTIAFPIILILVFGTIFLNQDNMSFVLYVQDLDQSGGIRAPVENARAEREVSKYPRSTLPATPPSTPRTTG